MNDQQITPAPGDDNLALLKQDIDSGRTGDKVATPDPGLSSLGTDNEAGGVSPTPAQISLARRQETGIGAGLERTTADPSKNKRLWPIVGLVGVIVLFAIVIAARVLTAH